MLTVIIFIIVLGVLVFVHEFGHFITAKRAGMKVEEFGFGFPPRIFGVKKGETLYSINWIPLGGFVKIFGEGDPELKESRSFYAGTKLNRSVVVVAGVVMNVILAFILLSLVNFIGVRKGIDNVAAAKDVSIEIVTVALNSPASAAGLMDMDEILGFKENGSSIKIPTLESVQKYIKSHGGSEITMVIKRDGEILDKKITPRVNPPSGEGATGIVLVQVGTVKYSLGKSIIEGVRETGLTYYYTAVGYATVIKNVFVTGKPGVELTGPVGIAVYTGKVARMGFVYLLQFMALISINLAVLNIIPFPVFDGGKLLFIIVEALRKKPLPRKVEYGINAVGFVLILVLMVYVTTKDIFKFF
ncbi:MAG: hypothetical protein CEN90_37 [Parcubacteria group bacterium Licking1014_17]|nr:MAG: hypothetical protein CEN90_37 [Parcubacteria group bacterium Licking1014_17]